MVLLKIILMYIVSFFVVAITPNFSVLFFAGFYKVLRKWKTLFPMFIFVFNTVFNFIAVFIIVYLSKALHITPTLLMLIIPLFYSMKNGLERVNQAKRGNSGSKHILKELEQEQDHNQSSDIINEYSYLISDLGGLLLGIFYFLNGAPIF